MNLIVGAPWWLIALLCLALIAAAIEDAVRLRISNLTCAAVLLAAIIAMFVHGLSFNVWQNALVCVAILIFGTPAFASGWLGGGDVKLLSAVGLWFNLSAALGLIAAILIAGGLVAAAYIVARHIRGARSTTSKIPYGLAIVGGAVFTFVVQFDAQPRNQFIDHLRATQAAAHE